MSKINSGIIFVKKVIDKFYKIIDNDKKPSDADYSKKFLSGEQCNEWLYDSIKNGTPLAVSRLGAIELQAITFYLRHRNGKGNRRYYLSIMYGTHINAGFFPPTNEMLDRFSSLYLDEIRYIDGMAVCYNPFENIVLNEFCPKAQLFLLSAKEPYYHENPWSRILAGKKVLIVYPLEDSIKNQYKNRTNLFRDKEVLPEFSLITLKPVQSIAGNVTKYKDWFEALESMKTQMEKIDFDIAIIGAGAYSLPLTVHAKKIGKQAIHLGGATQILFGIKGDRWDNMDFFVSKLYNDYWIRPSDSERPVNYQKVERGAYW